MFPFLESGMKLLECSLEAATYHMRIRANERKWTYQTICTIETPRPSHLCVPAQKEHGKKACFWGKAHYRCIVAYPIQCTLAFFLASMCLRAHTQSTVKLSASYKWRLSYLMIGLRPLLWSMKSPKNCQWCWKREIRLPRHGGLNYSLTHGHFFPVNSAACNGSFPVFNQVSGSKNWSWNLFDKGQELPWTGQW